MIAPAKTNFPRTRIAAAPDGRGTYFNVDDSVKIRSPSTMSEPDPLRMRTPETMRLPEMTKSLSKTRTPLGEMVTSPAKEHELPETIEFPDIVVGPLDWQTVLG